MAKGIKQTEFQRQGVLHFKTERYFLKIVFRQPVRAECVRLLMKEDLNVSYSTMHLYAMESDLYVTCIYSISADKCLKE